MQHFTNAFITHNQERITGIDGTCYQGNMNAPYKILVKVFGEPMEGCTTKTQAEWEIRFEDGTVATIYDWKVQVPKEEVTQWNIGGRSYTSVAHVIDAVDNFLDRKNHA